MSENLEQFREAIISLARLTRKKKIFHSDTVIGTDVNSDKNALMGRRFQKPFCILHRYPFCFSSRHQAAFIEINYLSPSRTFLLNR